MFNFDYAVVIGRFSPFHNAHAAILKQAFKTAPSVVVVLGSSNTPRTIKNPWSSKERREMIESCLTPEELEKISFIHMKDYLYDDNAWLASVQEKVGEATDYAENVALVGYESDETSWYLKVFPQYTYIPFETEYKFHATDIRDLYFSYDVGYKNMVPDGVQRYLETFKTTPAFEHLKEEKNYIDRYKEGWRGAPFPPIFVTVDCAVVKSGHILVVTRKCNPGKGLSALPGGFLNQNELIVDGAIRELKEETGIKVPINELKKSITMNHVFDAVGRSARGRTISNGYLINLGTGPLPQVRGADDAAAAHWISFSDFGSMENEFFEDHFHIIQFFLRRLDK